MDVLLALAGAILLAAGLAFARDHLLIGTRAS
jgi:hypothetical protein